MWYVEKFASKLNIMSVFPILQFIFTAHKITNSLALALTKFSHEQRALHA